MLQYTNPLVVGLAGTRIGYQMSKAKGITAWLVTWERIPNGTVSPATPDQVAAILNRRLGGERVRQLVELLYLNSKYVLYERLKCAKDAASNPYPAHFGMIHGARFTGEVTCGHNPYLHARLVDGLCVEGAPDTESERLIWTERPRPTPKWINKTSSG